MLKNCRSPEGAGVSSGHGMNNVGRGNYWLAITLLVAAGLLGVAIADVSAEEVRLTPEQIRLTNPDLYRQIQAAPKLPPEKIDPDKPYAPYPGFFAQPVLKPDQIEEWWETSAFDYSPTYPYLLKHTHMKFAFSSSTGNDDGSVIKGGVFLALRKDMLTNIVGFEIDKRHIKSADGSSTDKDVRRFEETVLFDLNRYLFVEAGFHWQRLSQQMIKNRYIPYVGIGSYNLLQDIFDKKKDRLGVHLGFGRVKDEYYPVVVNMINKDSDTFKGLYARADFSHKFNDTLTYKQNFILKHAIDSTPIYSMTTIPQTQEQKAIETGSTKRYDWRWTNSLEFALNQYVGFLLSYDMAYDSNPWPIAVKRDTEFMAGIKFAF